MQVIRTLVLVTAVVALAVGCQKGTETGDKDKTATPDKPADDATSGAAGIHGKKPPTNPHGGGAQQTPPMDTKAPPATATKTDSGISYVVLAEGKGGDKPGRNDTAQVHYSIWKTSGQTMFSTKQRGRPQEMVLSMVPDGWSEMLNAMVVGEKRMVWMPGNLAMRGGRGPAGETFVFELELTAFEAAPPVPDNVAGAPADAKEARAGVKYKVLEPGKGKDKARYWDQIQVHYTAWTSDGRMFESTRLRKQPRNMVPFQESKGWSSAVEHMVAGQKTRVWMPAALMKKRPGMPEGDAVYDVEVIEIKKQADPPPVPKNVAAPPADAKKTEKGVFYKVLKKGKGKEKPTPDSQVQVQYTGWSTDGFLFDSSFIRGQPAEFSLNGVIAGWTDGLQVMVVGETTRFWIPVELAYKNQPGRPAGMLVFDIELLDIKAGTPRPKLQQVSPHGKIGGQKPGAAGKPGAKPAGKADSHAGHGH